MSNVKTGERYAKSPLTGSYYHVTKWEVVDGKRIKAREKTEVEREEVPDEWLEVLDNE